VSYSRKDTPFVDSLFAALKEHGKEVWLDRSKIGPTEEILRAIFRAIEAADAVVFVLSPDSIVSEHCAEELAHAIKHEKMLMSIVCRDVAGARCPTGVGPAGLAHVWGDKAARAT
jgi:hypothetical protein